jgi:hypothetical protein
VPSLPSPCYSCSKSPGELRLDGQINDSSLEDILPELPPPGRAIVSAPIGAAPAQVRA